MVGDRGPKGPLFMSHRLKVDATYQVMIVLSVINPHPLM